MFFADPPRFVPLDFYEGAVVRMSARLATQPGVQCLYQIGHVSTPGVSDLDLLVVFQDDAAFLANPLDGLSRTDRYLFVHAPFAVTCADFSPALNHTFFHNYQLRWGAAPVSGMASLPLPEQRLLQRQVALEYLVRMWVSLTVELTYGIVKLRNLFLHVKGLLYDCEFLGLSSGRFLDAVHSLVALRANWFQERPAHSRLASDVHQLHLSLQDLLSDVLAQHSFYLPPAAEHRLARHVRLVAGSALQTFHSGTVLPAALGWLGRKYFNVQHRWNRFDLHLPFRTDAEPPVVARAFALRKQMSSTRGRQFPHFLTLSSSLAYA